MRITATITQNLTIEVPDETSFEDFRKETLGQLSYRYDCEEAHCTGTPEDVVLGMMEGVMGGNSILSSSTINISEG